MARKRYNEEDILRLLREIEVHFHGSEPPHLNWSTAMFMKWRTENGQQATEAGRDCLEVSAS